MGGENFNLGEKTLILERRYYLRRKYQLRGGDTSWGKTFNGEKGLQEENFNYGRKF